MPPGNEPGRGLSANIQPELPVGALSHRLSETLLVSRQLCHFLGHNLHFLHVLPPRLVGENLLQAPFWLLVCLGASHCLVLSAKGTLGSCQRKGNPRELARNPFPSNLHPTLLVLCLLPPNTLVPVENIMTTVKHTTLMSAI